MIISVDAKKKLFDKIQHQFMIKNLKTNKNIGLDGFTGKFHPTFREELTSF